MKTILIRLIIVYVVLHVILFFVEWYRYSHSNWSWYGFKNHGMLMITCIVQTENIQEQNIQNIKRIMMNNVNDNIGDLPVRFFVLLQLAEDEIQMLYNCEDVKACNGKGYYYDVMEEFNKGWRKMCRALPRGEADRNRESFCEAADAMEGAVSAMRADFAAKCADMFDGSTQLIAHLVMVKFMLKAADTAFTSMCGGNAKSRLVYNIMQTLGQFAGHFRVKGKGKGLVVTPDEMLVKAFSDSLERAAMAI